MGKSSMFGFAAVAVVVGGCATSASGAHPVVGESTFSGTAAMSSYSSTPRTVVATNESGTRTSTSVGASGAFSMHLKRGHVYRIAVVTDAGAVPLVFPRSSGKTTTTFRLASDGAALAVGSVRFMAHTPHARAVRTVVAPSLHALNAGAGGEGDTADGQNGPNDDQQVQCENGSSGNHDDSGGLESSDDQANQDADVAVGDNNIPENVDGCGIDEADGENNNDQGGDNQQG